MNVKCPSCGFDSPEGASWCDFCKEPFKQKTAGAAPPREAAPPAAQSKPPALKYYQPVPAKRAPPPTVPQPSAPAVELKDDEKVPEVPKWFRYAAWAFLGVWVVAGMVLAGILYGRYKIRQEAPEAPAPRLSPP